MADGLPFKRPMNALKMVLMKLFKLVREFRNLTQYSIHGLNRSLFVGKLVDCKITDF